MRGASVVLILGALLVSGCSSSEGGRKTSTRKTKVKPKHSPRPKVTPKKRGMPPGHVHFSVRKADLKTEVLPYFARQAGVRVRWNGAPREVRSLSFAKPIHWRTAMDLLCRFTRTHLTKDYQGRYLLKEGWGGHKEPALERNKPGDTQTPPGLSRRGSSGSSSSGSSSSGRSSAGSSSSSGSSPSSSGSGRATYSGSYGKGKQDAYSGGKRARSLLKGVGTRNSGQ